MKSIFVGSLAVYLSIVCSNAAFGQQSIGISISGSTFDNNQASKSFNQNSGSITDPKFAIGELDQSPFSSSDGRESVFADASASAGNGHLSVKVDVQASTGAGPPAFNGANATGGAAAGASYEDNLHFHFNQGGTPGEAFYVYGLWNLSGTLSSSAVIGGEKEPSPYVVNGAGSASLSIAGGGLSEFYSLNPRIAFDQTSIENSGASTHSRTDPPTQLITVLTGTVGNPVTVSFSLSATAGAYISSADILSNMGGLASGNLDFSHTAAWGGITSVTDVDGDPIIGWTVTSDTGFDYTQAYVAPEPSTFVLFGTSAQVLLLASRRRREKTS